MSKTGNTVQCGVYMLDGASDNAKSYPITFSGSYSVLGVPNDVDDYYIIYPGFKVDVQGNNEVVYTLDNTTGTIPLITPATSGNVNEGSAWNVYYMYQEITGGTVTSNSVSVDNNIGNSVQCGVYMIDTGGGLYPVPFTGNTDATRVPENKDNYYMVYPGFKVTVSENPDGGGSVSTYDNTNNTRPQTFTPNQDKGSYWKVYYINKEIVAGISGTNSEVTIVTTNNTICNTIQCGVFMINTGGATYPIPRTGTTTSLHVKGNSDDYYLVYPGFCVYAYSGVNYDGTLQICNNTSGTSPQILTPQTSINSSESWRVYYFNYQIN